MKRKIKAGTLRRILAETTPRDGVIGADYHSLSDADHEYLIRVAVAASAVVDELIGYEYFNRRPVGRELVRALKNQPPTC